MSGRLPTGQEIMGRQRFKLRNRVRDHKVPTIRVAGIDIPDAIIPGLALRLHRAGQIALATHVGRAWDRCYEEVALDARDCRDILMTLDGENAEHLIDLREALIARARKAEQAKQIG
jgi:hypothetical protein